MRRLAAGAIGRPLFAHTGASGATWGKLFWLADRLWRPSYTALAELITNLGGNDRSRLPSSWRGLTSHPDICPALLDARLNARHDRKSHTQRGFGITLRVAPREASVSRSTAARSRTSHK